MTGGRGEMTIAAEKIAGNSNCRGGGSGGNGKKVKKRFGISTMEYASYRILGKFLFATYEEGKEREKR